MNDRPFPEDNDSPYGDAVGVRGEGEVPEAERVAIMIGDEGVLG